MNDYTEISWPKLIAGTIAPSSKKPRRVRLSKAEKREWAESRAASFSGLWAVDDRYFVKDGFLKGEGNYRMYPPAAARDLPTHLAEIHWGRRSVEEFAHLYGLLGYHAFPPPRPKDWPVGKPFLKGEPVEWIKAHARTVAMILTLKVAIDVPDEKGEKQLRKFLSTQEGGPFAEEGRIFATEGAYLNWPTNPRHVALDIIRGLINKNIRGISWQLDMEGTTLKSMLHFRALFQMVYWHLAELVRVPGKVKRCKECARVFLAENPRAEFCPPANGSTISRCRSRYNVKKFRKGRGRKKKPV